MNKMEFAEAIGEKAGMSKAEGEKVLAAFVEVVTETLHKAGEINITGFGSFSVSDRKARTGVNPQNPSQKIQIPATRVPKFKSGKGLKDAVKSGMLTSTIDTE